MLLLQARHDIVAGRAADDHMRAVGGGPAPIGKCGNRGDDVAERRAGVGLDDDGIARTRRRGGGLEAEFLRAPLA